MGLCKCERKRVTNLFCFEHRVNVCEFCMVSSHPKCVVKSYLRWVKDSDFNPTCGICREALDQPDKDCIRLLCLDVFHTDCLDRLAREAPPNVAPAGYLCPSCEHPIIPERNHGGPVAEAIRAYLKSTDWAETDLPGASTTQWSLSNGLTPVSSQHPIATADHYNSSKLLDPRLDHVARQFLSGHDVDLRSSNPTGSSPYPVQQKSPVSQRRDVPVLTAGSYHQSITDDNDKHRRRSRIAPFLTKLPFCRWRVRRRQTVLVLVALAVLFLVFVSQLDRSALNTDDMFDPHHNPNVHIDRAAAEAIRQGLNLDESHLKAN